MEYELKFMEIKQDFTWEMDIDILSSEVKTKKYTYFGTYFTHENYHRRLAGRKLPMEKPNNGWVLQGWNSSVTKKYLLIFKDASRVEAVLAVWYILVSVCFQTNWQLMSLSTKRKGQGFMLKVSQKYQRIIAILKLSWFSTTHKPVK